MIAELTDAQRDLVRHALGLDGRRSTAFRNFFVTDLSGEHAREWHAMVAIGAARRRRYGHHLTARQQLFHVTLPAALSVLKPGECLDEEDFPSWLR